VLVATRTETNSQEEVVTMTYHNKSLLCLDCQRAFGFSTVQQQLYGELGFEQPVRCRACLNSREDARSTARQIGAPVDSVRAAVRGPSTVIGPVAA
jgi:hypothetical protein